MVRHLTRQRHPIACAIAQWTQIGRANLQSPTLVLLGIYRTNELLAVHANVPTRCAPTREHANRKLFL